MILENITNAIKPLNNNPWNNLPPEILVPFTKLITLLQIAGIAVLIYTSFLLIKGILNWKRNKKIDITYKKVLEIDKKLDELLKKRNKETKKIEKQKKKPGLFSKLFRRKEKKLEKIEKNIKEKKKK